VSLLVVKAVLPGESLVYRRSVSSEMYAATGMSSCD